jgi:hypothetical protein
MSESVLDALVAWGERTHGIRAFRLIELFRRVATEVAVTLGYAYPLEIDERMSAHLSTVRDASRISTEARPVTELDTLGG